ncbi:MAG: phage holin family protein [Nitrospirota bacterium]
MFLKLMVKWLINSVAVFVASYLVKGIIIEHFWAGVIAAAVLGIVNAFIKPVIFILTLPITLLTLGFFTLIINALMLRLVSWAVDGFVVSGFWAAFWGALIISIVSWFISMVFDSEIRLVRGGRR